MCFYQRFHCTQPKVLIIIIYHLSALTDAPDVSITPTTSLTVNVTDMASINCSVFGIPLPNVTWIVSDDGLEMEVTSDGDEIEIVETDVDNTRVSVLMFNNVSKFDEGLYSCIGRNDIDNVLNTPTSGSISFIVQGIIIITIILVLEQGNLLIWK